MACFCRRFFTVAFLAVAGRAMTAGSTLQGLRRRSQDPGLLAHHHLQEADEDGCNRERVHHHLGREQEMAELVVVALRIEPIKQRITEEGRPKQPPQASKSMPRRACRHDADDTAMPPASNPPIAKATGLRMRFRAR